MSIRITSFRASALLLAIGLQGAMATETGKSLYEQRKGIFQGTSRGILLFGGNEDKPAAPAKEAKAAAPAPGAAPAASASPATAAEPGATAERAPLFSTPSLSKLAPPSGIPLNSVRHQVGADRGVALPVAKPASDAKP